MFKYNHSQKIFSCFFSVLIALPSYSFSNDLDESININSFQIAQSEKQLPKIKTIVDKLSDPVDFCLHDNKIYLIENHHDIFKKNTFSYYDLRFGKKIILKKKFDPKYNSILINKRGNIFLLKGSITESELYLFDLKKKKEILVTKVEGYAKGMVFDDKGSIYINVSKNPSSPSILKVIKKDGKVQSEVIKKGISYIKNLNIYKSNFYFNNLSSVYKTNKSNELKKILSISPESMVFNSDYLYYSQDTSEHIGRINLKTKQREVIGKDLGNPKKILYSDKENVLYYVDNANSHLGKKTAILKAIDLSDPSLFIPFKNIEPEFLAKALKKISGEKSSKSSVNEKDIKAEIANFPKIKEKRENDKVKNNMNVVQNVVETYGGNYDGLYPFNSRALISDAKKDDYWKDIKNPFGSKYYLFDFSNYQKSKKKLKYIGLVLYEGVNCNSDKMCKSYNIYGIDKKGGIIKDKDQNFILKSK